MDKIIAITDDRITIGTSSGGIRDVRKEDLSFLPKIGDKVEIFENDSKIVVVKSENTQNFTEINENLKSGININVNNSSNNNNTNANFNQNYGNKVLVNKVIYIIMALLLGWIGGHKFYAGKSSSGIMYLLFFWSTIPMLISLFDAIVAFCQRADSNGNILV